MKNLFNRSLFCGMLLGAILVSGISLTLNAQSFVRMGNIFTNRIVVGDTDVAPTLENILKTLVAKGYMTTAEAQAAVVHAEMPQLPLAARQNR
jgi:hypothetical protein